jgi:hypothetical protein
VLMTVLPAYTYEHHLVFLLLPVLVAASTTRPWLFLPAYFFLAWPLDWLKWAQRHLPPLDDWIRESKTLGEAAILLLLFTARSSVRPTDPGPPAPGSGPS